MLRLLALCLFVVFTAAPSLAANGWFANSDCTDSVSGVRRGATVYYCNDSTHVLNAYSPILLTEGVLSITRLGNSGGGGAGTCEVTLFGVRPTATTVSGLGGALLSGDTDGDGVQNDLSLNGSANRRGLYDVVVRALMVRVTTLATIGEQCAIEVASR